jgi:hypothetical protein
VARSSRYLVVDGNLLALSSLPSLVKDSDVHVYVLPMGQIELVLLTTVPMIKTEGMLNAAY